MLDDGITIPPLPSAASPPPSKAAVLRRLALRLDTVSTHPLLALLGQAQRREMEAISDALRALSEEMEVEAAASASPRAPGLWRRVFRRTTA